MSGDTEDWECVGFAILRSHVLTGASDYQLARRKSDGAFAIVKQISGDWVLHGPVVNLDTALRTAEHVAAGDSRALTWNEMPLMLATALLAFDYLAKSNMKGDGDGSQQQPTAPAPAG